MKRNKKIRRRDTFYQAETDGEVSKLTFVVDEITGEIRLEEAKHGSEKVVVTYEKENKNKEPKQISVTPVASCPDSLDTIKAMFRNYDSFFAIDTNTKEHEGHKVSVSCSYMLMKIKPEKDKMRLHLDLFQEHLLIDADIPEKAGWYLIIKQIETIKQKNNIKGDRIAIFVDHDINKHDDINNRKSPVYQQYYLPAGYKLLYATGDTTDTIGNLMVRACDRRAKEIRSVITKLHLPPPGLIQDELPFLHRRIPKERA